MNRRTLLRALAAATGLPLFGNADMVGSPLPLRREGELDIHHIDTGRGNCTLIVGPDGTSMMIDAGASAASTETSQEERPNGSRRPGEWQARYALRQTASNRLNYLIATHLHPDHIGDISGLNPKSESGSFRLTGVSDVDALMPIDKFIDRAFPDYGALPPPAAPFANNYQAFLRHRRNKGRSVEPIIVGSDRQLCLRHVDHYPSFRVRTLAANGLVWSGSGEQKRSLLPDPTTLSPEDRPNENILSIALRLSYGRFSYFAGGDLTSDTHDGKSPWMDVETPVVQAAGRTEVAAADHHGYFDACGPAFVRNLAAQAYVIQAWDVGHPGFQQLQRMLGDWSNRAIHDVFTTGILPANALINRRFVPLLKSRQGHVVIRVSPGGDVFRIIVLDSSAEDDVVKAVFGPYYSRD